MLGYVKVISISANDTEVWAMERTRVESSLSFKTPTFEPKWYALELLVYGNGEVMLFPLFRPGHHKQQKFQYWEREPTYSLWSTRGTWLQQSRRQLNLLPAKHTYSLSMLGGSAHKRRLWRVSLRMWAVVLQSLWVSRRVPLCSGLKGRWCLTTLP